MLKCLLAKNIEGTNTPAWENYETGRGQRLYVNTICRATMLSLTRTIDEYQGAYQLSPLRVSLQHLLFAALLKQDVLHLQDNSYGNLQLPRMLQY